MGCWAHARRKFVEALELAPKDSNFKNSQSYHFLEKINQLFQIEREVKGKSYDRIYQIRQEKAKPILEQYLRKSQKSFRMVL